MPADQLNITIIQPDLVWEDKEANLKQLESFIAAIKDKREVVVLPEMFTTGFSMRPKHLAETMDGVSVKWMKNIASKYRCIITGSLIIEEDGKFYNRLLWMQPDGKYGVYDKRHLFAYAHEDEHYTAGERKLIVSVKGWKICPLICYDLRFPVWSRNSLTLAPSEREGVPNAKEDFYEADSHSQMYGKSNAIGESRKEAYDVLLYVANWPQRRSLAWKTLLQARAIENQAYVVGVNRVGTDGKDIKYSGDSSVFDALGEMLWQNTNEVVTHTITLQKESLQKIRSELPFLKDADQFLLL
ncbi:MAG TPA: nitrilase family protein [Flavipsychrobacter sp.]|nr:nitrilase family protein [Flavipsychrobacter sp.]